MLAGLAAAGPAQAATSKSAVLVVDANTGHVLYQSAADEPRHPASLAKMMTIYITFELIEQGRLNFQTKIKFSANAAAQAPSKLDAAEGEEITLLDAIKILITKSANDVAVAVAEHIAGSEAHFARLMTQKAHQLGMTATVFRNASGLPDDQQVTTARDMVTLALRLQDDFPRLYPLFATRTTTYKDETFRNHNTLLFQYQGTDGLKTGYTRASGFNLVASVRRGKKHVIGAIFGGASASSRNTAMRTFLNIGLVKASNERTRQPATALIAQTGTPAHDRRIGSIPQPQRVPRPTRQAAAPAPAPAEPVAARLPPAASAGPPVEIARVRSVLVTPQPSSAAADEPPSAAEPVQYQSRARFVAAEAPDTGAGSAAPPLPTWPAPSASAMPPQHTAFPAAAPIDRPALFSDPTLARGAAPSTLGAQAANLSRGDPPVVVPPPAATAALPTHATPSASPKAAAAHAPSIPKRRPEATASTSAGAGGFQVQIGAFQSQAEAERQLATVRERAGGLLARGTPVALQVQQGQKVFYRARYLGFDAQTAIKACAELKRLKVECLVAKAE